MNRLEKILSVFVVIMVLSFFFINFHDVILNPSITGFQVMSTRLVITSSSQNACNFTFEPGWNLISFACITTDTSLKTMIGNYTGYESIRAYNPGNPLDAWRSYNPSLPPQYIQDLDTLSRREGYWININGNENQTNLYINNSLSTPTLIDLSPGWNLIGYPSRTTRTANETFNSVIPNFNYVYMFNASDIPDPWKEYTWNSSLPSIQDLLYTSPGYGYWIYMANADYLLIS